VVRTGLFASRGAEAWERCRASAGISSTRVDPHERRDLRRRGERLLRRWPGWPGRRRLDSLDRAGFVRRDRRCWVVRTARAWSAAVGSGGSRWATALNPCDVQRARSWWSCIPRRLRRAGWAWRSGTARRPPAR